MSSFKNVLWWLIINSLGGINRGKIIEEIIKKPQNAHELSKNLGLNYRTVRYHLELLEENRVIVSVGHEYGKTFFPSDDLKENEEYFWEIWRPIKKKKLKKI